MIEFGNFSAQSFERLIQALSANILGAGVTIFGSGPDGAREATFEGPVPFPSLEDRWDGYIVVQAKCREVLKGDARDAVWLVNQLKQEFEKFLKNKSLRRPDYYIIATNVTLSPELKNGGRSKVERLIASYKRKLKFKAVTKLVLVGLPWLLRGKSSSPPSIVTLRAAVCYHLLADVYDDSQNVKSQC